MADKIYFKIGKYKVTDYKDTNFALYQVINSNQCFNDLNEAILFCIGKSFGEVNESSLLIYIDTFLTMVKKKSKY